MPPDRGYSYHKLLKRLDFGDVEVVDDRRRRRVLLDGTADLLAVAALEMVRRESAAAVL